MNKFLLYGIQVIFGMLGAFICALFGLKNPMSIIIIVVSVVTLFATKYKLSPIIFYITYACIYVYFFFFVWRRNHISEFNYVT